MTRTKQERRDYRNAHTAAASAVRQFGWNTKTVANPFTMDDDGEFVYQQAESHRLEFPLQEEQLGHYISVSFGTVKGHPEMIRVRSSNYRAEDEPNGLYATEDARRFYAQLLKAGFRRQS